MIATITKLGGFARTYGHARLYYMVLIALGTLMGSGFIVKWFAGRAKRRGCAAPVIPTGSLPQQLGTSDRQEEKSQLTEDVPLFKQDLIDNGLNKVPSIAHATFIPIILAKNNINTIAVKGLEADDVIACAADHALHLGWKKVYILSADKDLSHIAQQYPGMIEQWTMSGKPMTNQPSLLEHIILGDKSDNIPSCLQPGQGKKYLQSLLDDDAAGLKRLLKTNPTFVRCFQPKNTFEVGLQLKPSQNWAW